MKKIRKSRKMKNKIRKKMEKMGFFDENSEIDEEKKEFFEKKMSREEFEIYQDIFREMRMDRELTELDIDPEDLKNTKKKIIKINPKSKKLRLISQTFKKSKGKYKVEDLITKYHDTIFKEGYIHGFNYGKRFFIEDIQNNELTVEKVKSMNEDEIYEYTEKEHEI